MCLQIIAGTPYFCSAGASCRARCVARPLPPYPHQWSPLVMVASDGMLVHDRNQQFFDDAAQTAGTALALHRFLGDGVQRVVGKDELGIVQRENSSLYWCTMPFFGSVRTRTRASSSSGSSTVTTGRRPISSGMRPRLDEVVEARPSSAASGVVSSLSSVVRSWRQSRGRHCRCASG